MLDLLFTDLAYMTFGNCAATFINGSTAEGGNTAGDPLMKAEAQLRTPLHCFNLRLMCEQQPQHEVHQRFRGKREGTPDTRVAVKATKKLDNLQTIPNCIHYVFLYKLDNRCLL